VRGQVAGVNCSAVLRDHLEAHAGSAFERMSGVGVNELELLDLAVRIATDAASTAYRMRSAAITEVDTKSTLTDVVTAADRAVVAQAMKDAHEAFQHWRSLTAKARGEFAGDPAIATFPGREEREPDS